MKIAVFPGSFDPVTRGHEAIVLRAANLFDKVIVAVGINNLKSHMFSAPDRIAWLHEVFGHLDNVEIESYEGLTVDFCTAHAASYIIRGLRTSADFEFERSIGQVNRKLHDGIETVFFLADPEHSAVNSSIVRDLVRYGGDVKSFIPDRIDAADLRNAFRRQD